MNKQTPLPPVHPGEILREDFLAEMGVTAYRLAKSTGMPVQRVSAIVNEKRAITADTALRLGRFFGVDPQWWMNMQARFDLETAKRELGDRLEREVNPMAQAS
jgi:antitoxin HigA-1